VMADSSSITSAIGFGIKSAWLRGDADKGALHASATLSAALRVRRGGPDQGPFRPGTVGSSDCEAGQVILHRAPHLPRVHFFSLNSPYSPGTEFGHSPGEHWSWLPGEAGVCAETLDCMLVSGYHSSRVASNQICTGYPAGRLVAPDTQGNWLEGIDTASCSTQ